uniref:hypothetical protein n=1 Tax=Pedobacter schmidteae TaxID=2201271 RepID=UPI000EB4149A|nr:hypothetical protein [Pedobacter schmidteae]
MRKSIYLVILFSLFTVVAFAQSVGKQKSKSKKNDPALNLDHINEAFSDCAFTNKYSPAQRLSKYPFSKAVKILAVSYKYGGIEFEDEIDSIPTTGLHVKDGILNTTTLIEMKQLTAKQIDQLSNLIFNTGYKKQGEVYVESTGRCFEPRNAFVFFDSAGKVFDYFQVCFGCKQSHSQSDRINIGVNCTQKYKMFSDYFKSVGIKYGTLGKEYKD